MESASLSNQADWQRALTNDQARAAELFGRPETEQKRLGYFHTLKEICQQPWTWLRTCDRMIASRDSLKKMWQEFVVSHLADPAVQSTPPNACGSHFKMNWGSVRNRSAVGRCYCMAERPCLRGGLACLFL